MLGHASFISGMFIALLVIHFAEAAIWAGFYTFSGGLPDFETAFYFSLTSYTTIGYGDVLLPKHLRIIGSAEGMVGTFMCGWSVAIIAALLHAIVTHNPPRATERDSDRGKPKP